jgi:hypothetical protein
MAQGTKEAKSDEIAISWVVTSDPSQTQNASNRKLVRSHAMRAVRRQQKIDRASGKIAVRSDEQAEDSLNNSLTRKRKETVQRDEGLLTPRSDKSVDSFENIIFGQDTPSIIIPHKGSKKRNQVTTSLNLPIQNALVYNSNRKYKRQMLSESHLTCARCTIHLPTWRPGLVST